MTKEEEKIFEKKAKEMGKNVEDMGEKIGKKVEKSFNSGGMGSRFGSLVAMLLNLLFWWLLVTYWRAFAVEDTLTWGDWQGFPFLTNDFEQIIPWMIVSIIASIIMNGLGVVWVSYRLNKLTEIIGSIFGLVVFGFIMSFWPYDFSRVGPKFIFNDTFFWIILICGSVGMAIGLAFNIVKLLRGKEEK